MKVYVVRDGEMVEAKIQVADIDEMPLSRDGWNFDWRKAFKEGDTVTYVLKVVDAPNIVHGLLQLKTDGEMVIMNLIEISPENLGGGNKRLDDVAGCLIAFACRESFKAKGNYQGYLSFQSKTELIVLYQEKYGAETAGGQMMFIDPTQGLRLISQYLERGK